MLENPLPGAHAKESSLVLALDPPFWLSSGQTQALVLWGRGFAALQKASVPSNACYFQGEGGQGLGKGFNSVVARMGCGSAGTIGVKLPLKADSPDPGPGEPALSTL